MRARGYGSLENALPKKPKTITPASVRKLKKITTEKLYKTADFTYFENGEPRMVSGAKGRKIERQVASEKAVKTRKRNIARARFEAKSKESDLEPTYGEWLQGITRKDKENIAKLKSQPDFASQFTPAEMIKIKMSDVLAEKSSSGWSKTVDKINAELNSAIASEGEAKVYARLAQEPDFLFDLEEIFYKEGDHIKPQAFMTVISAIRGRALTAEETRAAQDRLEQDLAENFDPDELA